MAGHDLTAHNALLKDWYTIKRVETMVYKDNPFLSLVPKVTKFPGKALPLPVVYGEPTSTSAGFDTAQTLSTSATAQQRSAQFYLTRVQRYGVALIDGETMAATESDEGAFMKAATAAIDGVIHQVKRNLAVQLFGSGWGAIGTVGSNTGSTITLANPDQITNVEVGQRHVFSATESADALRDSGDDLIVTGVNRMTGVITYSETIASVTGLGNGDFIFLKGDRQDLGSSTAVRVCIAGLEAWCPQTAPTSTAFFGVDRTADTRLGGCRLDATDGRPIEEALIDGAVLMGREGYGPTHYFMNFAKWGSLEKSLHGKVNYSTEKGSGNVGFNAITIRGPRGDIKCIADQNCPPDRIFGVNFDYLKLYSLGPLVRTINDDGNLLMRSYNSDAVESRHGFRGNLGCTAPVSIINIKVTA